MALPAAGLLVPPLGPPLAGLPFSPLRLPAVPEAEGPAWMQTLGEEGDGGTQQAELEDGGWRA